MLINRKESFLGEKCLFRNFVHLIVFFGFGLWELGFVLGGGLFLFAILLNEFLIDFGY